MNEYGWKINVGKVSAVEAFVRLNPRLNISAYLDMLVVRGSRLSPTDFLDGLRVLQAMGRIGSTWNGYDNLYFPLEVSNNGG